MALVPIRPQDIDQTIQAALKDRITQIFSPHAVPDPVTARVRAAGTQRWRETARKYTVHWWVAGTSLAASVMTPPIFAHIGEAAAGLSFLGFAALGAACFFTGFLRTQKELVQFVSPDVMRAASHLIALSRAEQLYCEAVAALIDAESWVGEAGQREILGQLNISLASYRALETPVRQLRAELGGSALETLEQELAALAARRDAAEDPGARGILDQSVALCARRLEHARALEPAREKAEAQQELILQSLATVQASLARTCAAPSADSDSEVDELRRSMQEMNRRAKAIEDAVAEVATGHS
jgi:hypothetical protein